MIAGGRRQDAGMRLLGKEQGHNIGLFIKANPPLPLPAFWFSRVIAVNSVTFLK